MKTLVLAVYLLVVRRFRRIPRCERMTWDRYRWADLLMTWIIAESPAERRHSMALFDETRGMSKLEARKYLVAKAVERAKAREGMAA